MINIKNFRKNNCSMTKLSFCNFGVISVSNDIVDGQSIVEIRSKEIKSLFVEIYGDDRSECHGISWVAKLGSKSIKKLPLKSLKRIRQHRLKECLLRKHPEMTEEIGA